MTDLRATASAFAAAALALAALVLLPAAATAHAELVSSMPADGEVLDAPPHEIVLDFDDELLPDGSRFTVTGPAGETAGRGDLDLQVAARNVLRGAVDASAPGEYVVAWSVVARDGHSSEGSFAFSVGSPAATHAPATAVTPDTAAPAPASSGALVLLGLVLAGVATGAALARGGAVRRR